MDIFILTRDIFIVLENLQNSDFNQNIVMNSYFTQNCIWLSSRFVK